MSPHHAVLPLAVISIRDKPERPALAQHRSELVLRTRPVRSLLEPNHFGSRECLELVESVGIEILSDIANCELLDVLASWNPIHVDGIQELCNGAEAINSCALCKQKQSIMIIVEPISNIDISVNSAKIALFIKQVITNAFLTCQETLGIRLPVLPLLD